MMKTIFLVYLALVVLALSACKKAENNTATVPAISTECLSNPTLCNSNVYNQNQGFQPYPNNYNGGYNGGFYGGGDYSTLCSCPYGMVPTYNNYSGLGCVQSNFISGYFYASFSFGANNNQWTNIPQISNTVGYGNQRCYNGVIQSCLVTNPGSCGLNYTCRANSASSALGICVSNTGVNNYYGSGVR